MESGVQKRIYIKKGEEMLEKKWSVLLGETMFRRTYMFCWRQVSKESPECPVKGEKKRKGIESKRRSGRKG